MSRAGEGGRLKKHNCCLTCSIVCFIIFVVFFATIMIAGPIVFNSRVSDSIGGLTFSDVVNLAANALTCDNPEKVYGESDLDEFYSQLSHALFLADKTDTELQYELVSDEKRGELATLAAAEAEVAAAEEESTEETAEPAYDNDAAFDYFKGKLTVSQRYAYATTDLSEAEFAALATSEDARKKAGLHLYRLDLTSVMNKVLGSGDVDFSATLENELSSMAFSFDSLSAYEIVYESDSPEEKARKNAANQKLKVFEVAEKPAAAFIDDIVTSVLKSEKISSALQEGLAAELDLSKYIHVASVNIARNPLLSTTQEAVYGKDTVLAITLSIEAKSLVYDAIQTEAISEKIDSLKSSLPSILSGIDFNSLIPNLVPKYFSANVTVYPFAEEEDNHEVVVLLPSSEKSKSFFSLFLKNTDEENAKNISVLLNTFLSNGEEDVSRTFLCELNDKVVSAFKTINETVPVEFVATKDLQGNDVSGLRLATWETVVNLIQKSSSSEEPKFDVDDVLIVLKGVFDKEGLSTDILETAAAVTAFKGNMSEKYGLSSSFLNDNNLLESDTASKLPENIDLVHLDYSMDGYDDFDAKNDAMQVNFPSYAIADYLEKVLKGEKTSSSEVAAAEEESSSSSANLTELGLEICEIKITEIEDTSLPAGTKVFAMTLEASVKLGEYIKEKLGDSSYVKTLFSDDDKPTKLGISIYISEYTENGKIMHAVGSAIDHPGEENVTNSRYEAVLMVNKYDEKDSKIFLSSVKKIMSAFSEDPYDISSVTKEVEGRIEDLFKSLSDNKDLKLDLKLYGATATEESAASSEEFRDEKGGITLPSIFSLVANMTYGKLNPSDSEEPAEIVEFSAEDAWKALSLIYDAAYVDSESGVYTQNFIASGEGNDAQAFLNEINDKYYFKDDKGLTIELLFGKKEGESTSLSDSITADNINFDKLYADERSIATLHVQLNGKNLAALVANEDSGLLSGVAGSFGDIKVIGAHFASETGETYLYFDLQISTKKDTEDESVQYKNLFPSDLKLSAKVHMTGATVDPETSKKLYPTTLIINDDDVKGDKVFLMMKAFGGDSFNAESIAKQIGESIGSAFNDLDAAHLKVDYTVTEDGSDAGNNYVKLDDVFSLLVNSTEMTDRDFLPEEEIVYTAPEDLMDRLRGFGKQKKEDAPNTDDTWIGLDTFSKADYDYVDVNLKLAYFLNGDISIDSFYNGFSAGSGGTFDTISDTGDSGSTGFNLSGTGGLFKYEGNVVKLKISDKALGYVISQKESGTLSAAVPSSMTAEIVSLTFGEEEDPHTHVVTYTVTCGIKIAFLDTVENPKSPMMPDYFYILSTTVIGGEYDTTIAINDIGGSESTYFFHNFSSLAGKGLSFSFNKSDIETQIGAAFKSAFEKMGEATFDRFEAADFTAGSGNHTYTAANYTVTPAEGDPYVLTLPTVGDICISFPSVYHFISSKLYENDPTAAPADDELQSMIVEMHRSESYLDSEIVTNPKSDQNTPTIGFIGSNIMTDSVAIYSDKNLAKYISDQLNGSGLDNNSLGNLEGIEQLSVIASNDAWQKTGVFNYTAGHAYLLTTAKVELSGYSTGSVDLLPSHIYLTVLFDMSATPDASQALLFDMSTRDMEILTEIINRNKQGSADTFDKDEIAETIADLIRPKIQTLTSTYGGNIAYYDASDSYVYYGSIVDYNNSENEHDFSNEADGVGYIVISH